jgi:hypothetical protein
VILWETGINQKVKETLADVLQTLDQRGLDDVVIDLRFRDQVVLRLPTELAADGSKAGDGGPIKATSISKGTKEPRATPASGKAARGRRRA